jgi:hypothetical protein
MGIEGKERRGKEKEEGWIESLAERTEISIQDQLGVQKYLRVLSKRNNQVVGR